MKKFSKYFIVLALILFVAMSAFISCKDPSDDSLTPEQAEAAFWVAFKEVVNAKVGDVADVEINENDITVEFIQDAEEGGINYDAIEAAARVLFGELKDLVTTGTLTLTVGENEEGEFDLFDDEIDVVKVVALYLLDGMSVEDFETTGEVEAEYSAEVTYEGVKFNLEGTLKFDVADVEE